MGISKDSTKSSHRRFLRFKPDPGTYAMVQLGTSGAFRPGLLALVVEEAYGGASLVVVSETPIKEKSNIRTQIGKLHPMTAEVCWVKKLAKDIYHFGIKFNE